MGLKDKMTAKSTAKTAATAEDPSIDLANIRRENAELRTKLAEKEKLAEQLEQLAKNHEAKYIAEKIRRTIHASAIEANAVDPDDVVELTISRGARIDGDEVVFGDGDKRRAAKDFVREFVDGKPHLKKAQAVAQGSGASATAAVSAPAVVKEEFDLNTAAGRNAARAARYRELTEASKQ